MRVLCKALQVQDAGQEKVEVKAGVKSKPGSRGGWVGAGECLG